MTPGSLSLALLACFAAAPAPAPTDSIADQIVLHDGKTLLGQVVDPPPRGATAVLVRRAWAVEKLPEWAKRWQDAETGSLRHAIAQRRDRLVAWKRDRAADTPPDDEVSAWIDREIARLSDPAGPPRSPLMIVKLNRSDFRSVVRRPKASARLLRLGWLSGFANVEEKPASILQQSLEDRGFGPEAGAPGSLNALLPITTETDAQWLDRRAATEVGNDSGLKFVRTSVAMFPEPEPGQPLALGGAISALSDLKKLIDGDQSDPLADRLATVAGRGRVGALVTRLEISDDMTAVRVESLLLVRYRAGRWMPAARRFAEVRTQDLAANAGAPLEQDPQVKAAFNIVESLGLGNIPDDVKRRSLNVGAATQRALAQVRGALLEDLSAIALPVHSTAPPAEKPPAAK